MCYESKQVEVWSILYVAYPFRRFQIDIIEAEIRFIYRCVPNIQWSLLNLTEYLFLVGQQSQNWYLEPPSYIYSNCEGKVWWVKSTSYLSSKESIDVASLLPSTMIDSSNTQFQCILFLHLFAFGVRGTSNILG